MKNKKLFFVNPTSLDNVSVRVKVKDKRIRSTWSIVNGEDINGNTYDSSGVIEKLQISKNES